jgi:hypothetical protein
MPSLKKRSGSVQKTRETDGRRAGARHLYWYIAAVTAALMLLIGTALLLGRMLLAPNGGPNDAASQRAAHTSGSYVRRLEDGVSCRVTVFDQDRGEMVEDKITQCEELRQPSSEPGPRPASSFKGRPGGFSWGGK